MNPLNAWKTFWFRPVSARPLGVFRIVLGLSVLGQLANFAPEIDYWLTDAGVMRGDDAVKVAGPFRPSPLQYIQDPVSVRTFVAATAAVAVVVTVGWHARAASVVLYLMMLAIHNRSILTNCGPDALLMILLFLLALSPSGAAYSLDARRAAGRRGGTVAEPLMIPWAQRLIQLQISMIYLSTCTFKANGKQWLNGTAIHYVLQNVEVRRFNHEWVCQYPLAINALTYAALLTEFALALLLWSRPTRRWVAVAGVGLHAGIFFTVNVPLFGEMMTACYLLFLDSDELDGLLRAVNPRNWLPRRAVAPGLAAPPVRVDGPETLRGMHASVSPAGGRVEGFQDAEAN